jgi:mRNA-degrading endonuclease YafQ of YafQ-DinJ toxin-antitoxin module
VKIKFHDDFKANYQLLAKKADNPRGLTKALNTVVDLLWAKGSVEGRYVTNRLSSKGLGWFECYLYHDKKYVILIHYKIAQTYVYLSQIGTPQTLTDEQSIIH